MLYYFHQLPDLGILAVVLTALVTVMSLAPIIGTRLLSIDGHKARDEAAFDAFKTIMSMIGVVLAFSLVQANSNLRSIEETVGREASAISAADRVLLRINDSHFAAMRPMLSAYGQSLVHDEWPQLARSQRSAATDAAFTTLSRAARATVTLASSQQQSMYGELLDALDNIADYREQIISDSSLSLPSFFWVTVAGLFMIGFFMATMTEPTLNRRAGLAATTAATSLLLAFVIIIDVPFEGDTRVNEHSIVSTLQVIAHRT